MTFTQWKGLVLAQTTPVVFPKDWYWAAYGRYCQNVKTGKWPATKLLGADWRKSYNAT